ncbi:MAG: DUF7557 family protein [Atribacterota bacterium]
MVIQTSIRVQKPTLLKLKEIGKKEETYDEIILRLLEIYNKQKESKK